MQTDTPIATEPRDWRVVAQEHHLNLRELGELIGRQHTTMLAYSMGKRPVPKVVLIAMGAVLGEPVR